MSPSSIDEAVSLSYVGLVQAMTASVNSMRANRPVMNLEAGADAEALGGRWSVLSEYVSNSLFHLYLIVFVCLHLFLIVFICLPMYL